MLRLWLHASSHRIACHHTKLTNKLSIQLDEKCEKLINFLAWTREYTFSKQTRVLTNKLLSPKCVKKKVFIISGRRASAILYVNTDTNTIDDDDDGKAVNLMQNTP